MLRVVIDTSTLVSFVLTAGDMTRQIILAWRAGEFTLITSPETRQELRRVLQKPPIVARAQAPSGWLADEVERFSAHVPGSLKVTGACRDPKDDMFLACALEGQAAYLVSSDRDLLVLRRYDGVCVLNPGEFLIALQLRRLAPEEIKQRYSQPALRAVLDSLCLDAEARQKVATAVEIG
jgi:putative PIN family toxin of toxin-antitoxin system